MNDSLALLIVFYAPIGVFLVKAFWACVLGCLIAYGQEWMETEDVGN